MSTTLVYKSTTFNPVANWTHAGIWLRGSQIATALGYPMTNQYIDFIHATPTSLHQV